MTERGPGGVRLADLEVVANRLQQGVERYGDAPLIEITHDSRQVREGTAFVALPDSHLDGHHFAAEAVTRGAAALIVSLAVSSAEPSSTTMTSVGGCD